MVLVVIANNHWRISWELGGADEVSAVHDLGAHKIIWQIVAASSAESLLSGFFNSMDFINTSKIEGTLEVKDGKSDILKNVSIYFLHTGLK